MNIDDKNQYIIENHNDDGIMLIMVNELRPYDFMI